MTFAELVAHLQSVLAGTLGTYTPGTPALYVVRDRDTDPPPNWTATGLECLIYPPRGYPQQYFGGHSALELVTEIKIIQHDRSSSTIDARRVLTRSLDVTLISETANNREGSEEVTFAFQHYEHLT
jgi:hypothetical protein